MRYMYLSSAASREGIRASEAGVEAARSASGSSTEDAQ